MGGADVVDVFPLAGGDGFPHHGAAALAAVHHAGEQLHSPAADAGAGVQGKHLLDALKIVAVNNGLMAVLHHRPFLAGLVHQPLR